MEKRHLLLILFIVLCASLTFAQEVQKLSKDVTIGLSSSRQIFDSYYFQSAIKSGKSLGTLAKENFAIGEKATTFGFAAKSREAKFFIIGSLYSETIAYLKSGNNDFAAKRLGSIGNEFINMGVAGSLYNYITKMGNIIQDKKYSNEVKEEFLALFQPFFEDYAKNQGEDKLTLFRAGSWLVDMGLTAAAGNKELLREKEALDYFTKEMKKMDAPKGVMDALDEIAKISVKKEITDRDAKEVLNLVKKIQTILG